MVFERGVLRAEIREFPPVAHVEPLGDLVNELRLTRARNTRHDTDALRLKRNKAVKVFKPYRCAFLHTVFKESVKVRFEVGDSEDPLQLDLGSF